VSTVPTDPVPPVSTLARATSPQAGGQSSGETSPFEAFLDTGHAPPSQTPSQPAQPSRAGPAGQSTPTATAANHPQAPVASPGTQPPLAPGHGSNGGSSTRTHLPPGSTPQAGAAADGTGATAANLPAQTLTDPAGASASTTGEPTAAATDSVALRDPTPATPARKSDKVSVKADEANTVALAAPSPVPTIIAAAAVTVPASAASPASAPPAAQPDAAATGAASIIVPRSGAALGGSAPAPALAVCEAASLPLDPTASGGPEADGIGRGAAEPTAPGSPSEKASSGTPASVDVALAKPMQALASAIPAPMASPEAAGTAVQSASPQAHIASATAPAAGSQSDVAAGAAPHFDPAGLARPDDASGPSGSDLARSATPPLSANPLVSPAAAPLTAAPAPSSPASPPTVPISGLAIEIAARATRDEKSFQIRLDPPELGRIDVQLNVDAGGHVTTRLTVDRPETLALLRQDASSLQRALESTGLKANSNGLEFSLRNQSFNGQGGGQRGGQSNGTTASVARIMVPDADVPAGQTATRGYARLLGVGSGVDIRV
jgi:flagellar hook-length control protein FliK